MDSDERRKLLDHIGYGYRLTFWQKNTQANGVGLTATGCPCDWCRGLFNYNPNNAAKMYNIKSTPPADCVAFYNDNARPENRLKWILVDDFCCQAKKQPKLTVSHASVTGFNCATCNERNDYACSNQPNGTYVCYRCR